MIFQSIHKLLVVKEGFENEEKPREMVFKENGTIYDDFYSSIYDDLVYNEISNDFQIDEIISKTKPPKESIILDIGSGTGHIVNSLHEKGFTNIVGVDNSMSMITKAIQNFPNCKFIKGNIEDPVLFQYDAFTHILCLYFTIYYLPDKFVFFKNCFQWLKSGGSLVIHLVNPSKFDPIMPPANPLLLVNPQRYAPSRMTKSKIFFNNFIYNSEFIYDETTHKSKFIEKFKTKDDSHMFRRNEHQFFMEPMEMILQMAQGVGFIVMSKIDMVNVNYEYNYLYVLQKP